MAVFTHVTEDEIRDFLTQYDLGAYKRHEGIAQGVENTNYHLFTDQGRYILTIFEKRIKEEDLPFIFSFTEHLAKAGVVCPEPYRNKEGNIVSYLQNKPAALTKFLTGSDTKEDAITAEHCQAVGWQVALMHLAAASFTQDRKNPVGLPEWEALIDHAGVRADEVQAGLAAALSAELAYLKAHWPADLPSGAVHADLFPDNVFFDEGCLSGAIDFYFSCHEIYAYDLAVVINAWCFDAQRRFDSARYEALMQGYENVRPLRDEEKASLPVLRRAAAVRFLATRLNDWLFHPGDEFVTPKNPTDYVKRLEFFKEHHDYAC